MSIARYLVAGHENYLGFCALPNNNCITYTNFCSGILKLYSVNITINIIAYRTVINITITLAP